MTSKYNPWPLGKLPKEWQRPELDQLEKAGYEIRDARDAITFFEDKVAKLAGCKYAIAVDSCTNALFLSLRYHKDERYTDIQTITIPSKTYCSVPNAIEQAGFQVAFYPDAWKGTYPLRPLPIIDSAVRFTKGMYIKDTLQCLSFQIKKRIPIGKGGMILTDDEEAAKWLRIASHDGRHLDVPYQMDKFVNGWHMYMTPEDAARGILLMDQLPSENEDSADSTNYPDLRTMRG